MNPEAGNPLTGILEICNKCHTTQIHIAKRGELSGRKCFKCGSLKTAIDSGWPKWYRIEGTENYLCRVCHDAHRRCHQEFCKECGIGSHEPPKSRAPCPTDNTHPEQLMRHILKHVMVIPFTEQYKVRIGNRVLKCDFRIEPKLIIMTDGDRWHANWKPHIDPNSGKLRAGYRAEEKIIGKKTGSMVWAKDARITAGLENLGYTVLRFWHSELVYDVESVQARIRQALQLSQS